MMCRIFFVWNVFENSYCDWKQQLKEIIKYKNKNIKFEIPKWQNTIDKELIDPRKWKKKY